MAGTGGGTTSSLDASVVAAIDNLDLAARLIVEGLRTGANRSPFHGFTTEFRQHRPYQHGDDLKYLDWKLFARSDRLYTRQFRETTNLSVTLVLDTSMSMAFPQSGISKFRYASIIAAALAYLAVELGNSVGLLTLDGDRVQWLPPRGGRAHLRSLIARIDGLQSAGRFDAARALAQAAQLTRRRGLVIALSDFYDEEDAARREMSRIVRYGHDVAMLQVLSSEEVELPYTDQVEFEDVETGERRVVSPEAMATHYHSAMDAFLERCLRGAVRGGIDYALFTTAMPPAHALRDYLLRRRRGEIATSANGPSR